MDCKLVSSLSFSCYVCHHGRGFCNSERHSKFCGNGVWLPGNSDLEHFLNYFWYGVHLQLDHPLLVQVPQERHDPGRTRSALGVRVPVLRGLQLLPGIVHGALHHQRGHHIHHHQAALGGKAAGGTEEEAVLRQVRDAFAALQHRQETQKRHYLCLNSLYCIQGKHFLH
ncbi:hypothetical protein CEXT_242751 [Caerostris extrusa]|uniref:Uncharacterized protein n=1 Tax=Caerostris extrusa TaxID=172846 RepID=A0AAV4PZA3_CAEEX|nr:hypothetical protein CEXT_242751 [Caerostris extrusa]